jgi:tight adherence protein B
MVVEWVSVRRRRKNVGRQLERLNAEGLESLAPGASSLLRGADREAAWVQTLAARLPHLRDVRALLEQADLHWTVQSYLMLCVGLGVAASTGVLLATGSWLYAFGAGVAGTFSPFLYVRHRRTARLRKFEELFPAAVDLMGRAIRAGHPFGAGLKMVAEESVDPIATEFRRTFEEQRFGLPLEESLVGLADRIPLVDVRIFATALLIQREVGGNLAEILDNLASIIRQRFTLARQVQVLTAEGRMSMYVLGLLPFGVGLFVFYSNPSYVMTLFTHPIGHAMLGVAALLQVAGWIWMRRIIKIDF